jgi:hypothetical protein
VVALVSWTGDRCASCDIAKEMSLWRKGQGGCRASGLALLQMILVATVSVPQLRRMIWHNGHGRTDRCACEGV